MTLSIYQIFTPLLSLFAIFYTWNLTSRRHKSVWQSVIWTLFWVAISTITLWPRSLSFLSSITGIQDRENAVFSTAIGILFFILFYVLMKLEVMQARHNGLIRYLALKDFKKENKQS